MLVVTVLARHQFIRLQTRIHSTVAGSLVAYIGYLRLFLRPIPVKRKLCHCLLTMGSVAIGGALCGRASLLRLGTNPPRHFIQASVKERDPIGGRVDTGAKSKTDPKDLLIELQRLRGQRARLRAELTTKEQKLKARDAEPAQPDQQSNNTHADAQIESGNGACFWSHKSFVWLA